MEGASVIRIGKASVVIGRRTRSAKTDRLSATFKPGGKEPAGKAISRLRVFPTFIGELVAVAFEVSIANRHPVRTEVRPIGIPAAVPIFAVFCRTKCHIFITHSITSDGLAKKVLDNTQKRLFMKRASVTGF